MDPLSLRLFDSRSDLLDLLPPKHTVLTCVGVQTAYAHPGRLDTQLQTGLVGDTDDIQHPLLFYQITGLPQGYMGGYVYHPQVIVCQHHGVLVRSGVMGIDLGMPVEMVSGKIHGLLVQRVRNGSVYLARHSQLDDLFHALKSGISTHGIYLAIGKPVPVHQLQMQHIYGAEFIQSLTGSVHLMELQLRVVRHPQRIADALDVAYHQRPAPLVHRGIGQSPDGDLRTAAGGISHGDPQNRTIHMVNASL